MPINPEPCARALLKRRDSLILATADKAGKPTASYAPFVSRGNDFYIYISTLSRHTKELLETGQISILVIEDEHETKNIFARKRITFSCDAVAIPRHEDEWEETMKLFRDTFGNVFNEIRPLGDFVLFRLVPREAVYVHGFGKAFRLTGDLRNPIRIRGTGLEAPEHVSTKKASD